MAGPEQQPQRRQFVNFLFFKLDSAWHRLPESERTQGKQEFMRAVDDYAGKVMIIPYSTVGIRGDCDFMLWMISYELEVFLVMRIKFKGSDLVKYFNLSISYSIIRQ